MWDSRDKAHHYVKRIWSVRKILEPGHKNAKHHSLVESLKILLPPLHIKLGLIKNFVKAMDHNGTALMYLRQKFPVLSDAKIREGVLTGHFIVMMYLNATLRVISREHGMPSERWLQAFYETEEQITTRILWKNLYPHIRNWGAISPRKSTF